MFLTLEVVSISAYTASLLLQDQILQENSDLASALIAITLFTTILLHIKGMRVLSKSLIHSWTVGALSTIIVVSSATTLKGQAMSGIGARLVIKSSKALPTVLINSLYQRSWPNRFTSSGCALVFLGSLCYHHELLIKGIGSDTYGQGLLFLILSTLLDSGLSIMEKEMFFKEGKFGLDSDELACISAFWGLSIILMYHFAFGIKWAVSSFSFKFRLHKVPVKISPHEMSGFRLILFGFSSAIAYSTSFRLIQRSGAIYTDSFKVARKIFLLSVPALIRRDLDGIQILSICINSVGLSMVNTGAN